MTYAASNTYIDNGEYVQLFMRLLSVGVPQDGAEALANTVCRRTERLRNLIYKVINICELWEPWYVDPDSRIYISCKPYDPSRYASDTFVANVHSNLPNGYKRVVWSVNHGIVTDPVIQPKPTTPVAYVNRTVHP